MRSSTAVLSPFVLGAALVPAAAGQALLHVFEGTFPGDRHGWSVAGAGDVDGDGHADLVVGAYHDDSPTVAASGSVKVYSGRTGDLLYVFYEDQISLLGMSVHGAGDVDADGRPDIVAGIPSVSGLQAGRARVWSGLDGSVLYTFEGDSAADRFGHSVGAAGDVDGDGHDDVIVGAPWDDPNGSNSGIARVFSGADGSVLHDLAGGAAEQRFGWSVSGAGDVDGDGFDDVIVGASTADGAVALSGTATVFSGLDGSVLHVFSGAATLDWFGYSVSGAGDVDADGFADLIVGAWGHDGSGSETGRAQVYSGADGSVLHDLPGDDAGDRFGWSVSGAGDVDRDGRADLLVGALRDDGNGTDAGSARIHSGADGSVLYTIDGAEAGANLGRSVGDAGDVDADCVPDVVVGAYFDDGVLIGSATVVSGLQAAWTNLGNALPGAQGAPCFSAVGTLAAGTPVTLRLQDALASTTAFLVIGFDALNAPFKGGVLVPDADLTLPLATGPSGELTLASTWPVGLPSAFTVWLQSWIVDAAGPQGFAASNALSGTTP